MQHVKRADLILGELVRSFEIVNLDLFLLFICLDFLCGNRTVRKRRQQFIYLGLR